MSVLAASVMIGCQTPKNDNVVNASSNIKPADNIMLTVHVMANSVKGAKSEGLDSVTVTVSQNAFKSTQTTRDGNGMVIFSGLNNGQVSIFVKRRGYASINQVVSLTQPASSSNTQNAPTITWEGKTYSQVLPVTLNALGASAKGILTANNIPVANAVVRAFYSTTYEPNYFIATTDANGVFTFNNLIDGESASFTSVTNVNTNGVSYPNSWSASAISRIDAPYDFGTVKYTNTPANDVKLNGSLTFRPWGYLSYLQPATITSNYDASTVPSNVPPTAFYSVDYTGSGLPANINPIFVGVVANGVVTFSNLPTMLNGSTIGGMLKISSSNPIATPTPVGYISAVTLVQRPGNLNPRLAFSYDNLALTTGVTAFNGITTVGVNLPDMKVPSGTLFGSTVTVVASNTLAAGLPTVSRDIVWSFDAADASIMFPTNSTVLNKGGIQLVPARNGW